MAEHPNITAIRKGYDAFNKGDMETLIPLFDEAVVWHVPGRSPLASDYDGVAQVIEFFGRLFELSQGTLRLELHDVLANDEHAVALYTVRAEREGRRLEDNMVATFHVRDGKITEAWTQATDLYASDEFWS
jgi:ketosteroid isomerase-like protein